MRTGSTSSQSHLCDGRTLEREQHDYDGFHTRPMGWDFVTEKFERLAERHIEPELRARIIDAVGHLDELRVEDLTELLAVSAPHASQAAPAPPARSAHATTPTSD
ncbi:MAG: hypothetical protein H0W21_06370 [Actinobacteria bacterium]|nr:hypothetical protein [Actinomycetota bacterium]